MWFAFQGKYLAMSNEAMPRRLACNRDSVESPESARVAWEPRREAEVEREEDTWWDWWVSNSNLSFDF